MSLELDIQALTEAVKQLIAVTESGAARTKHESLTRPYGDGLVVEKIVEVKKLLPDATTPTLSPVSAPTVVPSFPISLQQDTKVTYDEVKKQILAVSSNSRDLAVALLARFGATSGQKLKEEQYAQFVFDALRVLSGEYDPTEAE